MMDRLKFWRRKEEEEEEPTIEATPVIKRFNIQPRTDIGTLGLPSDPAMATRLVALRRRREALVHDLAAAEEANLIDNRWRTELALISQAMTETARDLDDVGTHIASPGSALPPTPITGIEVETEPVVRVAFLVGENRFRYAEEIDWAERGTQLARSELILEEGNAQSLIPAEFPPAERVGLQKHLEQSLFAFASDLRDRALNELPLPEATLAHLARPSAEYGAWLDWNGQSTTQQAQDSERHRLRSELERLRAEQTRLAEEEAKARERLPIVRRRLAEVDREISAISPNS